jgi:hypothetical protein
VQAMAQSKAERIARYSAICADCGKLMTDCLLWSVTAVYRCPISRRHAAERLMNADSSLFPYPPQGHTLTVGSPFGSPNPENDQVFAY